MSAGLKKVVECLHSAKRAKEVAAVLVPRHFARSLVDELYPAESVLEATGVSFIDDTRMSQYQKLEEDRKRYHRLVDGTGFIGTIFGCPMVVADDVVLCALSKDEVVDVSRRLGFDPKEVLEG